MGEQPSQDSEPARASEGLASTPYFVDLEHVELPTPIVVPAPPMLDAAEGFGIEMGRRVRGIGSSPLAIQSRGPASTEVPWAVFGLPRDGAGSIWFLGADGVHPEPQRPGPRFGKVEGYGRVIANMGELDGDLVSEVLVSAFGSDSVPGRVFVVSPVTRKILHTIPAPPGVVQFGIATCPVKDFDRDGMADVAVLGVHAESSEHAGKVVVHVCSTLTGKLLHTPLQAAVLSRSRLIHASLRWLPLDLQSGGGSLLIALPSAQQGSVRAVDVESGRVMWRVQGAAPEDGSPWSIDLIDQDLDGDSVDEVIVGDLGCGERGDGARVRILSGSSGRVLTQIVGLVGDTEKGLCVTNYPDTNGDGIDEVLVGDERPFVTPGTLWMLSGRDGSPLRRFHFEGGFWTLGHRIDTGMDVDGRGAPDVLLSSYIPMASGKTADAFGVLSLEREQVIGHVQGDAMADWIAESDRHATRALETSRAEPLAPTAAGPSMPLGAYARISGDREFQVRSVELAESAVRRLYGVRAKIEPPDLGLGSRRSFAPVFASDENKERAPLLAFGLPFDGQGSLWFLTHAGVDSECLTPDSTWGSVTGFARRVVSIPDVDGDGVSDLVVSAPGADDEHGVVFVVSTMRREVVRTIRGPEGATRFGLEVCVLPDLDGDGEREMAVIGVEESLSRYRALAALHIVSLRTGEVLRTPLRELEISSIYGLPLEWLPAPENEEPGAIVIRARRNFSDVLIAVEPMGGHLRWQLQLSRLRSAVDIAIGSDVNDDGVPDVVVVDSDPGYRSGKGMTEGRVRVLSGRTGVLVHGTRGLDTTWGTPGLAMTSDLDGDGQREVLVMQPGFLSAGRLFVLSGADGEPLSSIAQSNRFYRIEGGLQLGADWDGGALPEYVVSADATTAGNQSGAHAIGVVSMETDLMIHYVTPSLMAG